MPKLPLRRLTIPETHLGDPVALQHLGGGMMHDYSFFVHRKS